jgi:predicted dehydrogenase
MTRPDRRTVLTAAAALPAWYLAELRAADEPAKPADKPKVALVGCGSRGRGVAKDAGRFGTVVAVCDVDAGRAADAAKQFGGATPYADFRKLLEKEKDVSVVVNGTADHWHTLVNLAALRAGKDVYAEKPLTHTVDEGKRVVAAVKATGRVLQTGTQQRSDPRFRLAVEVVRAGRLGKLKTVEAILPAGLTGGPFQPAPVPAGLDWDFWQGPTAVTEYVPQRCHFSFRYWLDYSGGTLTDWGAHHNDIALWGTGFDRSGPVSVSGRALSKPVPGGYTAPSEYEIEYEYANGVKHRCVSTTASEWNGSTKKDAKPGDPVHGVRFTGADGWLFVTRGKIEASRPEVLSDKFGDKEARLPAVNDHMGNFFDCVKTRKAPVCDAEIGHRSASVCHLGGIAVRLGRKLTWDPAAERFVGDQEADGHLAHEMRKPWTYDAI